MLLSEGQMSDYKGAALMIDTCPGPRRSSQTEDMTPTGSARRWSPGASRPLHPLKGQSQGADRDEPLLDLASLSL